MNKEIIKAMNRKPKEKNRLRKWWDKNQINVMRVIFFPLWIWAIVCDKITDWIVFRNKWDEERANEILSYYIPRRAEWVEDEKEFYFFDNGFGWSINHAKRHLKRKDRKFWKVNAGGWGYKMRTYLINEFELEGFTKEVLDTEDSWTEISFKINE
jgi:hypothetical protein